MREENFFASTPTNNSSVGPLATAIVDDTVVAGAAATVGLVSVTVGVADVDTIGIGFTGAGEGVISGLVVITDSVAILVDFSAIGWTCAGFSSGFLVVIIAGIDAPGGAVTGAAFAVVVVAAGAVGATLVETGGFASVSDFASVFGVILASILTIDVGGIVAFVAETGGGLICFSFTTGAAAGLGAADEGLVEVIATSGTSLFLVVSASVTGAGSGSTADLIISTPTVLPLLNWRTR